MQPQVAVVKIAPATLIAESMGLDGSKTLDSSSEILTKEDDWDELWEE